jgi:hypothetical protein
MRVDLWREPCWGNGSNRSRHASDEANPSPTGLILPGDEYETETVGLAFLLDSLVD